MLSRFNKSKVLLRYITAENIKVKLVYSGGLYHITAVRSIN